MDVIVTVVIGLMVASGLLMVASGPSRRVGERVVAAVRPTSGRPANDQRELVEGIAVWAENLRDTMAAASGLEQAIISTEHHSPRVISPQVQRLVASLRYGRLDDGLRRFADDIAHPTCDFVVAALMAASQHQTRDVTLLLGHLADCARLECNLYLRVWVSRARSRAAVRIITGAVGTFAGGLVLLNPGYLAPFLSVTGAMVMMSVVGCFVGALMWLNKMAKVRTPARFLSGRSAVVA